MKNYVNPFTTKVTDARILRSKFGKIHTLTKTILESWITIETASNFHS